MNYRLTLLDAKVPAKNHQTDAGFDLFTPIDFILYINRIKVIDIGVQIQLQKHTYALIKGKSKLATKGLNILGGVVDSGYLGNWGVVLHNCSSTQTFNFSKGDAIAQFIILPMTNIYAYDCDSLREVEEFESTNRGESGIWDMDKRS